MLNIIETWWNSNILGIEGYFYCKVCKKTHPCFSAYQYINKICPEMAIWNDQTMNNKKIKFALYGKSAVLGTTSLSQLIESPSDFEPTELQVYSGKSGEEILVARYMIEKIALTPSGNNRV